MISEYSKNDPIPELNRQKTGLLVILVGAAGSGKTSFSNKYIDRLGRYVRLDPDEIRLTLLKDPTGEVWDTRGKATKFLNSRGLSILAGKEKQNIILDTLGVNIDRDILFTTAARENGYKVIVIHIITPHEKNIRQNASRNRKTPEDFLIKSRKDTMEKPPQIYKEVIPDSYYFVVNLSSDGERNYKYFKYNGSSLQYRKDNGSYYSVSTNDPLLYISQYVEKISDNKSKTA